MKKNKNYSNWLSPLITGMANFSAQYNFQSIAIVLIIMSQTVCTSDDGQCKSGEQDKWVERSSSSVIFVGAVFGQLGMGFLGDFLNRSQALSVTLLLATFSSFLSAVTPYGNATSVYSTVIAFRFFLGVGLGGVYPLSATKSGEDSSAKSTLSTQKNKVNSIGSSWAFFWQIPGLLGPWLLGYILTFTSLSANTRWRLILGLGTVPSLLAVLGLVFEYYLSRGLVYDVLFEASSSSTEETPNSTEMHAVILNSTTLDDESPVIKHAISLLDMWKHLQDNQTRTNLLVCGGCWFLYDVVVYGLGLLAGQIIDAISNNNSIISVSSDANIRNICGKQLIALSLCTPATLVSIWLLHYTGLKRLQTISFTIIACVFLVMAFCFDYLKRTNPTWLFVLYCVCRMSLDFGVGITTFSMPAALFKHDIRSTFNGIASAMGKIGAVVGAYCFYDIAMTTSYTVVLYLCGVVALCGLVLTHFGINQTEIDQNTCGDVKSHVVAVTKIQQQDRTHLEGGGEIELPSSYEKNPLQSFCVEEEGYI